ncbi:MAG: cyanophycinase [Opitutaceae bacterium]|nr:cyanophycinase [Opitutaceae bacterium]
MAIPRLLLLRLALLTAFAASARGADYEYFLTGSAADAKPAQTGAGLLLMGGGGDVDAAFRWFVRQAGGGDIVVLRASGGDGYNDYLFSRIGGVDSVETLLFHQRAAADDPRVLAIIRQAEGIWLAGGDQSRYVKYWKDTPVGAALDAHVRAGKPLGGTSAGLAVLGEFSYSALEPGTLTSPIALQDPYDRRITLERDFLHLARLRGIITDSHFSQRSRLGRSLAFLARLYPAGRPDRLAGIGVDEKTALAIEADGSARVFTSGNGRVWLMLPSQPPETLSAGRRLTLRDVRVIGLGPDSRLDFNQLEVKNPAVVSTVSVVDGQLLERQ